MIAVVQRVTEAKVEVDGAIVGQIGLGLVVLLSVEKDDTQADMHWMAGKLATLRIFPEGEKAYDRSVRDIGGAVLLISNFTVSADTSEGRRPSLSRAASPEQAQPLFDALVFALREMQNVEVATGQFRAMMKVTIVNDGPSTFIVRTEKKSGN
jgi:D-tyrosyl-tRNA(Tyr) deacylase